MNARFWVSLTTLTLVLAVAASSGKAENWTDVPEVSDGYAASRDAIKRHVERLIDQLQKR